MAYKITGTLLAIQPTQELQSKSGKSYKKRDFVITVRKFDPFTGEPTDDTGNTPKFTLMGERCNDLDTFMAGDVVTVNFEISGRSYEKDGKTDYFTEVRPLSVYKNEKGTIKANIQNKASEIASSQPSDNDELPF